jgi:malonate-semialdehyde dehydrogenase (acetylating) / methylmalonate-semialdehyde dehydrogenase
MRTLKNYINGAWVESKCTAYLDAENPGTGEIISKVPAGCADDIAVAAGAASAAFESWRNVSPEQRI